MSGFIVGYGVVASGGRYLVIFAGIADVFLTVLHPDGFGFLSSRLYGGLFYSMRFLARPMPRRLRALVLSMAAPLMVPIVIGIWIILVLTGYACVYYVGMNGETFYFENPVLGPSFGQALYVSGTAISTLGFGDVAPTSGVYQALAVSEGLMGFGILTLSVTYVVGSTGFYSPWASWPRASSTRPRIRPSPRAS